MVIKHGVLARYKDFLPVTSNTPLFSLGEGGTPLVRCDELARATGCGELYFKLEGCNPTGSFKDRGMVVAVAKALEGGSKAIMCASTGNTSASAAAYAAYCGLTAIIVVPKGKVALGKLAQAIGYGAKIVVIDGNFDQALQIVRSLTEKHPVTLVNSVNPHRIEGQRLLPLRLSMLWAMFLTIYLSRWVTPVILPLTGRVLLSIMRQIWRTVSPV